MAEKTFNPDPQPWTPITDAIDLKHLGKLAEELSECGSAVARCIIQGVDGREPSTGELNRDWLSKEIADVICNLELVINHFDLDRTSINDRVMFKEKHLSRWHAMGSAYHG
jgi:NTP pyrophosphatase (non-canonical NTP hydrolase)